MSWATFLNPKFRPKFGRFGQNIRPKNGLRQIWTKLWVDLKRACVSHLQIWTDLDKILGSYFGLGLA